MLGGGSGETVDTRLGVVRMTDLSLELLLNKSVPFVFTSKLSTLAHSWSSFH